MQGTHHKLNRLFNQAIAEKSKSIAPSFKPKPKNEEEEELVDPTEPERILAAFKKKDYFRRDIDRNLGMHSPPLCCLSLPNVTIDDLGRPTWAVTDSDLSRAFRKASLRVHPDKNPSPDAREAFERLKEAKNLLQDVSKRGEIVKEAGEKELQRLHKEDPSMIRRIEKAKAAATAADYQASILAQAKSKQEKIVQQKMEKKKAREESSESESEEWKARRAVAEPAASSAKRALSSSLPRRKATPGILTSQRPHPLVSFHDLAGSAGEEDEEAQAWRILAALLARGFRGMPQQAAVSGPVAVGGQGHYTRVHPIVS